MKANVGPWNSSSTYSLSEIGCSGVVLGWRKVEYERPTRSRRSAEGISDAGTKSDMSSNASSANDSPRHLACQSAGSFGIDDGM